MKVTADDIAQLLASAPPRSVPAHVARAAKKGSSSWATALFGLGFGAFGMIFVIVFFPWRFVDELRLAAGAAEAGGTVTAVSDARMKVGGARVMEYQYDFIPPGGARQTGACYATGAPWSAGADVPVRYVPAHPELSCIAGARLTKAGWAGSFVIIFPAVGFGMAGWFVRQRIRTARVLRTGRVAEVDVLSVTDTRMKVNKQPVYAIELAGPALGARPVKVKRLNLADVELAARHRENKQPVFVLYDPRRPSHLIFPEALIEP